MPIFTDAELAYLQTGRLERGGPERRLARLATVGPDGTPHVTPVGMWALDRDAEVIEVSGTDLAATKKFRDIARTHRAAIVIDDVLPPFQPRGVEIRGRAEAITDPEPRIRIHPQRIVGWGLDDPTSRPAAEQPDPVACPGGAGFGSGPSALSAVDRRSWTGGTDRPVGQGR
jgi:pyridoxamine 5'-phosphate oxidase family protein